MTNGQVSEILHCRRWQMPWFPKYSIAGILQNRVIWEFSIADFSQNEDFWETTLPVSLIIYTVWAESENLHYKPTMLFFGKLQFCVKSTDFHVGKVQRQQCCFSKCVRIANTCNADFWKCPNCQHLQCCFPRMFHLANHHNDVFGQAEVWELLMSWGGSNTYKKPQISLGGGEWGASNSLSKPVCSWTVTFVCKRRSGSATFFSSLYYLNTILYSLIPP